MPLSSIQCAAFLWKLPDEKDLGVLNLLQSTEWINISTAVLLKVQGWLSEAAEGNEEECVKTCCFTVFMPALQKSYESQPTLHTTKWMNGHLSNKRHLRLLPDFKTTLNLHGVRRAAVPVLVFSSVWLIFLCFYAFLSLPSLLEVKTRSRNSTIRWEKSVSWQLQPDFLDQRCQGGIDIG